MPDYEHISVCDAILEDGEELFGRVEEPKCTIKTTSSL